MIIYKGSSKSQEVDTPLILTMGNFDGLHRGHKKIIRKVISRGRELKLKSSLLTFEPHPRKFLHKENAPPLILTREEKIDILSHWGVDLYIEVPFDYEFAKMEAEEFLEKIFSSFNIREIYVGEDFRFGSQRKGDIKTIEEFCKKRKIYFEPIGKLSVMGEEVSSTLIRNYVHKGDMEKAHLLLGRPFEVRGVVIKGAQRGRTLGFPTANIEIREKILPRDGVYVTLVDIGEENLLKSVSNVGVRPTFNDVNLPLLEIHIIDKEINLYGKEVRCLFLHKIRDEIKFQSIVLLKERMEKDKDFAMKYLSKIHLFKRKLFWG